MDRLDLRTLKNLLRIPRTVEALRTTLAGMQAVDREFGDRITRAERRLAEEGMALRTELLHQRSALVHAAASIAGSGSPRKDAPFPREDRMTLEACLGALAKMAPAAFPVWHELLEVNARAYDGFPVDSCSVAGHRMAALFGAFLSPYLTGTVLDIGCGPQPVPAYLASCPRERIAAIDPLLPPVPHPFAFAQGVTEFLPWDDRSFETVVCGTSLDHVLLLDRSLAEIRRVMKPDGRFVVWVAFVPGAKRYAPLGDGREGGERIEKVDPYHLFHFDRPWFEDELGELFACEERFHFAEPEISSFYCFRTRDPSF